MDVNSILIGGLIGFISSIATTVITSLFNKNIKEIEVNANIALKKLDYQQSCKNYLFNKRFDVYLSFEETVFQIFSVIKDNNDNKVFFKIFSDIDIFKSYFDSTQKLRYKAYWLSKQPHDAFNEFTELLIRIYKEIQDKGAKSPTELSKIGKEFHDDLLIKAHKFAINFHKDFKSLDLIGNWVTERHELATRTLEELEKHESKNIAN